MKGEMTDERKKDRKSTIKGFWWGFGIGMVCMGLILNFVFMVLQRKDGQQTMEHQVVESNTESLQQSEELGDGNRSVTEEGNEVTVAEEGVESGAEDAEAADREEENGTDFVPSNYVTWTKEGVYVGGDEVYFDGGIFKARWWTQGEEPARNADSVWEYLGDLPAEGMEAAGEPKEGYDTSTTVKREISDGDFKVVAYFPSWKEGQKNLDKLRFDIVTHVNYAFAIPTADGGLRDLDNPTLAKAVIEKAHTSGAKALIAVGGWSYNDTPLEGTFMEATSTDEKIAKFGDAIIKLCDDYGFDGVDIDWEHPRVDGPSSKQYEKLMVYLADKLHVENKILTSAVLSGVTADGLVYYDSAAHTDTVLNAVDWLNVMAYDGGDGERHSSYDFAVNCGNYWNKTRKLDASKVVLGVPFYGRPSWASYEDFLAADPKAADGDVANFNGMEAHYNGPATIRKKTDFALQNLGGVMIWEITHDTLDQEKSLLTAIGEGIAEATK